MSVTTSGLSVAGSIGGVAQAVGNLAALAGFKSGSWGDSLKPASFGGVPFGIESVRTSAGRNKSVHRYPFRDDVWVEDTGKKARQFEVLGFLVEDDVITQMGPVIAQRNNLLTVCETAGYNTLVHPTLGTIPNVACLGVETIERKDLGRVFEIRLSLIISGTRLFPTTTAATADAPSTNAALTGIAALKNFVANVASDIQAGAAVVQQAVSTAVGWYQTAETAINDVKSIIGAVSTLAGNLGRFVGGSNSGYTGSNTQASPTTTASDLLATATAARASAVVAGTALQTAAADPSDSTTLGAAVGTLLTAVAATASNPSDVIRIISGMAAFSPSPVSIPGQIGASMLSMQTEIAALFRRYALAQLAVSMTAYQPTSQNDASMVLSAVVTLFDTEITVAGDAGDDDTYSALRTLRESMIADMNARGEDLATIATFSFQKSLPSLALAMRLYRDATREPGLTQQINPVHPAFCPVTFKALAS